MEFKKEDIMKECPFCGEHEQEEYRDSDENCAVRCGNCGAIGPWHGRNHAGAINEWNQRGGNYDD